MDIFHVSFIEVCPIHFEKFDALNRQIGSIEETLLLSKIMFHLQGSRITKHGVKCIVRSRKHIANWFGFSLRKTDTLLSKLESKGFLVRTNGLWHGVKRLFLSVQHMGGFVPVNMTLLDVLIDVTGSIDAAITYARIAFIHARSKSSMIDLSWIFIRKNTLADYLNISIRKLDTLLDILIRKGLLLKKNMIAHGRRQTHFHIPLSSLKVLKKRFNDKLGNRSTSGTLQLKKGINPSSTNMQFNDSNLDVSSSIVENPSCDNCRLEPAKFATSIKIRTITKQTNNNTRKNSESMIRNPVSNRPSSDIHFSKRELAYLQGVLSNLITRDGIRVSNPKELLCQIKYALSQSIGKLNLSFSHGVNRLCAIIRSGNWSTPYGFYHYSNEGMELKADSEHKERQWQEQKAQECYGSNNMTQLSTIAAVDVQDGSTVVYSGSTNDVGQGIEADKSLTCRHKQGRIVIDGQSVLVSSARIKLNEIHSTIERHVAKMKLLPAHLHGTLLGVINRLRDEAQEITCVLHCN